MSKNSDEQIVPGSYIAWQDFNDDGYRVPWTDNHLVKSVRGSAVKTLCGETADLSCVSEHQSEPWAAVMCVKCWELKIAAGDYSGRGGLAVSPLVTRKLKVDHQAIIEKQDAKMPAEMVAVMSPDKGRK